MRCAENVCDPRRTVKGAVCPMTLKHSLLFPRGVTAISLDETKASLLSGKLLKIA